MPSNARSRFNAKLLPDVNQLIETHRQLNPTGRGRRALGHITRSGVVMLCAAWEIYIEEIIEETATSVLSRATEQTELNEKFNSRLAKIVREHKNDRIALRLCGAGWRELYLEILREDVASLNTPKFGNISSLFNKWVGSCREGGGNSKVA